MTSASSNPSKDLRDYEQAVRDRTAGPGPSLSEEEIRLTAITDLRDEFVDAVREAAGDPSPAQGRQPVYQLIEFGPELAFDGSWRAHAVVPSRDQYPVCPVAHFATIAENLGHAVQTEQFDALPERACDLPVTNLRLNDLLGYNDGVIGGLVGGAMTRLRPFRQPHGRK